MKRSIAVSAASLLALGLSTAPAAADNIEGTAGNDRLRGTTASDLMQGLAGDDEMWGLLGNDVLLGGEGADTLHVGDREADSFNSAEGGPGADVLYGGWGFSYMEGNDGNDEIWGGSEGGPDYGRGHDGDDLIQLGKKSDGAEPDWGTDTMKLGLGSDYVFIWTDGAVDTIWCGRGEDHVEYFGEVDPQDETHRCEDVFVSGDGQANDARWQG